jgi:hypothetical protein
MSRVWRKWTKEEDGMLIELMGKKITFPKMRIEGRSLRAIESRAFHLGLKLGTRSAPKIEHRVYPRRLKIGEIYCGE